MWLKPKTGAQLQINLQPDTTYLNLWLTDRNKCSSFVLMSSEAQVLGYKSARISLEAAVGEKFHYWFGLSGDSYLHTVFAPDACPALENASYIAVYRDPYGTRHVLDVGLLETRQQNTKPGRKTVNHRFAGANEIHLHLMAQTPCATAQVVTDLKQRHVHPAALAS